MLALVLVFTVVAATAADAPPLTFKFTKNSVPGARQTLAEGINNAGGDGRAVPRQERGSAWLYSQRQERKNAG